MVSRVDDLGMVPVRFGCLLISPYCECVGVCVYERCEYGDKGSGLKPVQASTGTICVLRRERCECVNVILKGQWYECATLKCRVMYVCNRYRTYIVFTVYQYG